MCAGIRPRKAQQKSSEPVHHPPPSPRGGTQEAARKKALQRSCRHVWGLCDFDSKSRDAHLLHLKRWVTQHLTTVPVAVRAEVRSGQRQQPGYLIKMLTAIAMMPDKAFPKSYIACTPCMLHPSLPGGVLIRKPKTYGPIDQRTWPVWLNDPDAIPKAVPEDEKQARAEGFLHKCSLFGFSVSNSRQANGWIIPEVHFRFANGIPLSRGTKVSLHLQDGPPTCWKAQEMVLGAVQRW